VWKGVWKDGGRTPSTHIPLIKRVLHRLWKGGRRIIFFSVYIVLQSMATAAALTAIAATVTTAAAATAAATACH
jgi:hypothetical protein